MKSLGYLIKTERLKRHLAIAEVSEDTKISVNTLKAIEANNFDVFPSDVYLRGFIKNYAKYLSLDTDKVLAILRRERSNTKESNIHLHTNRIEPYKFTITPGKVVLAAIALIAIFVFSFLAIQINKVIKPPRLTLLQPIAAESGSNSAVFETSEKSLTISGKVEAGSDVFINGNKVTTNSLEEFQIEGYQLDPGTNTIDIKAENQFLKTSQIILTVIFNSENTQTSTTLIPSDSTTTTIPQLTSFDVELKVEDTAWIEAEVDGESKINQVVSPGEIYRFTSNLSFSVYSPRPQIIKLTVNNVEKQMNSATTYIWRIENNQIVEEQL